jgi:hypothetical protein
VEKTCHLRERAAVVRKLSARLLGEEEEEEEEEEELVVLDVPLSAVDVVDVGAEAEARVVGRAIVYVVDVCVCVCV